MNWAYLAGFLDGEGCIRTQSNGPRITFGQKHREVLDTIQEFLGTNLKLTHSRNCYYLQFCKKEVVLRILENTLPFLIVKRQDALTMLSLWDPALRGT